MPVETEKPPVPPELKHVCITQYLTREQLLQAERLFHSPLIHLSFAQRIHDEIIVPNMSQITRKLNQAYEPMELAKRVEYVIGIALRPNRVQFSPNFQTASFNKKAG